MQVSIDRSCILILAVVRYCAWFSDSNRNLISRSKSDDPLSLIENIGLALDFRNGRLSGYAALSRKRLVEDKEFIDPVRKLFLCPPVELFPFWKANIINYRRAFLAAKFYFSYHITTFPHPQQGQLDCMAVYHKKQIPRFDRPTSAKFSRCRP